MARFLKKVPNLILSLVSILGLILVAAFIVFMVAGAKFATVLTDSMTDSGMPVGTGMILTLVEASEIEDHDFIYAESPFAGAVMHHAVGVPVEDANGRLQLTMKGSGNSAKDPGDRAKDAYTYDVTDGAYEVAWSVPQLGAMARSVWTPIPGTNLPFVIPVIFVLLLCALWPSKKTQAKGTKNPNRQP